MCCLAEACENGVPLCFLWQGAILFPNTRWLPLIGCRSLVQRRGSSPSCTSCEHARKYVMGFKRRASAESTNNRIEDDATESFNFLNANENRIFCCMIKFSPGYSYLNHLPIEEPLSLSVMLCQLWRPPSTDKHHAMPFTRVCQQYNLWKKQCHLYF